VAVYAYSIIDGLSIFRDHYRKRRSISKDAEQYLEQPDKNEIHPIPQSNLGKGRKFEDFVLTKFDRNLFSIVRKTRPCRGADDHYMESNPDPDYIFRYIPSREKFGVEMKFRSNFGSEIIKWSYPDQMARYKQFEKEEEIPVYIIIGLGGLPESPNEIFLVPLRKIESPELSLQFLSKYRLSPEENVRWQQGSFWNSGYLTKVT